MIVKLNKNYYGVWYLGVTPIELLLSKSQFIRFKKIIRNEEREELIGDQYESYSGMIYSNLEGSLKSYNEMKTHIALHAYHFTLKDGKVVMFWKV